MLDSTDQILAAVMPPATPLDAERFARSLFGVGGDARLLGSERDANFRIDANGQSFLLKIMNASERPDVTRFHSAILDHVSTAGWRARRHPQNREYILRNAPLARHGIEVFDGLDRNEVRRRLHQACAR